MNLRPLILSNKLPHRSWVLPDISVRRLVWPSPSLSSEETLLRGPGYQIADVQVGGGREPPLHGTYKIYRNCIGSG